MIVGLAAITLGCAPPAEAPVDTAAEVAAVRGQEVAAIMAGDPSAAYMTDDAVMLPPGTPEVMGKPAVRTWMQRPRPRAVATRRRRP